MLAVHWKRTKMRDELVRGGATIDLIAALMMGELDREHENHAGTLGAGCLEGV
jgi:hypothetical protein